MVMQEYVEQEDEFDIQEAVDTVTQHPSFSSDNDSDLDIEFVSEVCLLCFIRHCLHVCLCKPCSGFNFMTS